MLQTRNGMFAHPGNESRYGLLAAEHCLKSTEMLSFRLCRRMCGAGLPRRSHAPRLGFALGSGSAPSDLWGTARTKGTAQNRLDALTAGRSPRRISGGKAEAAVRHDFFEAKSVAGTATAQSKFSRLRRCSR